MPEPVIATRQMIKEIYDGAAKSYDRSGPSIFTNFGERLVEHLPLVTGMRLLDVATGKGAVLLASARLVMPGGHLVGIDLSGAMLGEAEVILRKAGLTDVELRRMDAEHLEFPDGTFDAVTCAFGLFMFPDMKAALREMYRVCKPGGFVGVTSFNKTPRPFDPGWPILLQQFIEYGVGVRMPQQVAYAPEEVDALLRAAGFSSVEVHSETNDIVYASEEDWWNFQLTVGPRLTIMGMNIETRQRFKAEYMAKLRPLFRQDGLHISLGVIYTVARR
ncbi:MAG: class I SAM-dependent methyltransferase [Chloroflexi bacterium]|nr:class I SAM-dependent methyltransferase [Chloroflexota bacterium]